MSAYLVTRETIDLLVRAAITYQNPGDRFSWYWLGSRYEMNDDRTNVGQLLLDENLRSLSARYPGEKWTDEPLYVEPKATGPLSITAGMIPTHVRPDPVVVLKCCACLEYQSCESDDWPETEAYAVLAAIKDAAIKALPGYEAAPWGIDG